MLLFGGYTKTFFMCEMMQYDHVCDPVGYNMMPPVALQVAIHMFKSALHVSAVPTVHTGVSFQTISPNAGEKMFDSK